MEIIIPGAVQKREKTFFCRDCGTVFKAAKGEYTEGPQWDPGISCKCPTCGQATSVYAY